MRCCLLFPVLTNRFDQEATNSTPDRPWVPKVCRDTAHSTFYLAGWLDINLILAPYSSARWSTSHLLSQLLERHRKLGISYLFVDLSLFKSFLTIFFAALLNWWDVRCLHISPALPLPKTYAAFRINTPSASLLASWKCLIRPQL